MRDFTSTSQMRSSKRAHGNVRQIDARQKSVGEDSDANGARGDERAQAGRSGRRILRLDLLLAIAGK